MKIAAFVGRRRANLKTGVPNRLDLTCISRCSVNQSAVQSCHLCTYSRRFRFIYRTSRSRAAQSARGGSRPARRRPIARARAHSLGRLDGELGEPRQSAPSSRTVRSVCRALRALRSFSSSRRLLARFEFRLASHSGFFHRFSPSRSEVTSRPAAETDTYVRART